MPTTKNDYKRILVESMCWRDSTVYAREHVFTPQQLGMITPLELKRWMCNKAYGTPNPTDDDDPTEERANSLEYYKKAISSFMPSRLPQWDVHRTYR